MTYRTIACDWTVASWPRPLRRSSSHSLSVGPSHITSFVAEPNDQKDMIVLSRRQIWKRQNQLKRAPFCSRDVPDPWPVRQSDNICGRFRLMLPRTVLLWKRDAL